MVNLLKNEKETLNETIKNENVNIDDIKEIIKNVEVENEGTDSSKKVNAKSIMGMMSLGLDNGEKLVVSAEGPDEEAAVEHIERFLSGHEA